MAVLPSPSALDLVPTTVTFVGGAQEPKSFSSVLLLADEADGTTLGGDRARVYTTPAGADADSAVLFSGVLTFIKDMLSYGLPEVVVGRVDTGGGESYADGLAAVRLAGSAVNGFYTVTLDSRVSANIVSLSDAIQSSTNMMLFQSADAGWLTASVPAGFSTIVTNGRTGGYYHTADAQPGPESVAAAVFRHDWNTQSQDFILQDVSRTVASLSPAIAETEVPNLQANFINYFGPARNTIPMATLSSVMLDGNPIRRVVVGDIVRETVQSAILNRWLLLVQSGRFLDTGPGGQGIVRAAVAGALDSLVASNILEGGADNRLITVGATGDCINVRIDASWKVGASKVVTEAFLFDIPLDQALGVAA